MHRRKKHIYSPNTVILDMKNQPDADTMLKIAKSIKGVKVDFAKSGQLVTIHYPTAKERFHIRIKTNLSSALWSKFEARRFCEKKAKRDDDERSTDTGLYHAMILK